MDEKFEVEDFISTYSSVSGESGAARNSRARKMHIYKFENLLYYLFFPVSVLYLELLLRLFSQGSGFFDRYLVYIILFSVACGGILWFIGNIIVARRVARCIIGVILCALTVIFITEYCVFSFFGTFFELRYMISMAADVATGFADNTVGVIISSIGFLLLAFVPFVVFVIFNKKILPDRFPDVKPYTFVLIIVVITQVVGIVLANHGIGKFAEDRAYYRSMYSANSAIPRFGLVTDLRLEIKYAVTGVPEDLDDSVKAATKKTKKPKKEQEVKYTYNVSDIDFEALAASTSDATYKAMHQYFGSISPTMQNEYTGIFKGKNLIMLTCEAFSPYVISKEFTPTLYKLQNEGFKFTNYYQPDWTQSTTGGEFAAMSGLVPTWVSGNPAFYKTANNYMPYSLGHQFKKIGYSSLAYHNNSYSYYHRDQTHPNMGYDYKGLGNGLKLEVSYGWPESDLEMMKATVSGYVDEYLKSGKKFNAYYMTVSGHCNYSWAANKISDKNRAATENMQYSTPIKAYLACQLEVEYAIKYIVDYCTEKGVIDDVVIVLTSDHYPYALTQNSDVDYYNELEGAKYTEKTTERYKNTLLIWSGSMKKQIRVDVPCSSIDVVPTVSNLFGLSYDSRLYSGRDILATNYDVADPDSRQPFVMFPDRGAGASWISCAGIYNAYTKTFTPYKGYEDYRENTDYITAMTRKANNMYQFSKQIVAKDYYSRVIKK